jgi:hypothetical protein
MNLQTLLERSSSAQSQKARLTTEVFLEDQRVEIPMFTVSPSAAGSVSGAYHLAIGWHRNPQSTMG